MWPVEGFGGGWRVHVVSVSQFDVGLLDGDPVIDQEEGEDEQNDDADDAQEGVGEEEHGDGEDQPEQDGQDDEDHLIHQVRDHHAPHVAVDPAHHEHCAEQIKAGRDLQDQEAPPSVVLDELLDHRNVVLGDVDVGHFFLQQVQRARHVFLDWVEVFKSYQVRGHRGHKCQGQKNAQDPDDGGAG